MSICILVLIYLILFHNNILLQADTYYYLIWCDYKCNCYVMFVAYTLYMYNVLLTIIFVSYNTYSINCLKIEHTLNIPADVGKTTNWTIKKMFPFLFRKRNQITRFVKVLCILISDLYCAIRSFKRFILACGGVWRAK